MFQVAFGHIRLKTKDPYFMSISNWTKTTLIQIFKKNSSKKFEEITHKSNKTRPFSYIKVLYITVWRILSSFSEDSLVGRTIFSVSSFRVFFVFFNTLSFCDKVAVSDLSVDIAEAVVCFFFNFMFEERQQVGMEKRRLGKWEREGLRRGGNRKEMEVATAILWRINNGESFRWSVSGLLEWSVFWEDFWVKLSVVEDFCEDFNDGQFTIYDIYEIYV